MNYFIAGLDMEVDMGASAKITKDLHDKGQIFIADQGRHKALPGPTQAHHICTAGTIQERVVTHTGVTDNCTCSYISLKCNNTDVV